ncbi:Transposase and inactivated derivatives [Klebsiella pneumoniae]|nr:Transposase and inactivated derivatives [Klebsiella pneumoniae]
MIYTTSLFHQYAGQVCRDFGAELKESNGESDHVHMLIEYPPAVQLSVLVNSLESRYLPPFT